MLDDCRAVVFDLDDTLLRTREVKWAHHREVAARFYGIDLTDEELRLHWGKPFDQLLALLYRDAAPLAHLRAANLSLDAEYPKPALGGAVDTVRRLLDEGFEVGVVTSADTGAALGDLDRTGFPVDRMLFVHGADVTPAHKPDPAVFGLALEELGGRGVGAGEVVYVGDALMDLLAARRAGLRFIGVTTGLVTSAQFAEHGAPWVLELAELLR